MEYDTTNLFGLDYINYVKEPITMHYTMVCLNQETLQWSWVHVRVTRVGGRNEMFTLSLPVIGFPTKQLLPTIITTPFYHWCRHSGEFTRILHCKCNWKPSSMFPDYILNSFIFSLIFSLTKSTEEMWVISISKFTNSQ